MAHAIGFGHPGGVCVAVAAIVRFPRQVAIVLRHPALDSTPVAREHGLHKDLPLTAQLVGAGAAVPRDEVRCCVEHFTWIVQNDAHYREGVGAGPSAEAVGVHGFEVLEGFGPRIAAGEERGEGEGAEVYSHSCSVHLHSSSIHIQFCRAHWTRSAGLTPLSVNVTNSSAIHTRTEVLRNNKIV